MKWRLYADPGMAPLGRSLTMAKGMEQKKEAKKAPQKTAKEKKAAKAAKKAGK
ncbi:MAG: hypothetical protein HYV17_11915 [Xanthomonadales bacterium]|nr:hypothetical protein [Xanthomonadales bacterium]